MANGVISMRRGLVSRRSENQMTLIQPRIAIAVALTIGGASAAFGQAAGSGTPLPGTGDSTKISSANREANANYNHLIGAGDAKPSATDDRPKRASPAVPATAADVRIGSALRDKQGLAIGTVVAVEPDGAVVQTGQSKIKVPLVAFGKDDRGLLLGITAARFNELVAKAKAAN
jgi:hypothetical protein